MGDERQPISDLTAALDQAGAALADVAGMLGDYRRQLVDAGFTPDEALELCAELQQAAIFRDRP